MIKWKIVNFLHALFIISYFWLPFLRDKALKKYLFYLFEKVRFNLFVTEIPLVFLCIALAF